MSVDGTKAHDELPALVGFDTAEISWPSIGVDTIHLSGIGFAESGGVTYYGYELALIFNPNYGNSYVVTIQEYDFWSGAEQLWWFRDGSGIASPGNVNPPFDIFQPFDILVEVSKEVFRVKGWNTSAPEPAMWAYTTASPAANFLPGMFEWRSQNRDNGTFSLSLDSFDISGVNRCTEYKFDNFNRAVASGWGETPSGLAWVESNLASDTTTSVDGLQADVAWSTTPPSFPLAGVIESIGSGVAGTPWSSSSWDMLAAFKMPNVVSSGLGGYEIEFSVPGGYGGVVLYIGTDYDPQNVYFGGEYYPFSWASQVVYHIRWHMEWNVRTKVRIWADGDPEPTDWLADIDWSGSGTPTTAALQFRLSGFLHTGAGPADSFHLDYIDFDYTGKPCYQGGPPSGSGGLPIAAGYLPIFRRQIGDPTTTLDSYICTMESAAMALDWHTRSGVQVWGGELIPWCGKSESEIIYGPDQGTTLWNAAQAWLHWSQYLENRDGQTWNDLLGCLGQGRSVVLQGDYGEFSSAEKCSGFSGNHAILVLPYKTTTTEDIYAVGDPLCSTFKGIAMTSLRAYAEVFGAAVRGSSSPQQIMFAVTRPWAV